MKLLKHIAICCLALVMGCASLTSKADKANAQLHQQVGLTQGSLKQASGQIAVSDSATQKLAATTQPTVQQIKAATDAAHAANQAAAAALADAESQLEGIDPYGDLLAGYTAQAVGELAAVKDSWAYKIGSAIMTLIWVIAVLFVIHFVTAVLALVLPPPYDAYAAFISKLVNPLGWISSLLGHFQLQKAVAATNDAQVAQDKAEKAVAEVVSDIKTHNEPNTAYTPDTAAVVTKVAGISAAAPIPVTPGQMAGVTAA